MKKTTWTGLVMSVALILTGAPAALGSYTCDQGCEDPPEGAEGVLHLCKTVDEGVSGAFNCFTTSTRTEYEDGTAGWSYNCELIWGPCKEASGVWLYPIA